MKQRAEFLVCWSLALLSAARGSAAIWFDSYWLASKASGPVHYVGPQARWLGAGEIGVALAFIGVWIAFSLGRRGFGSGVLAAGAMAALLGFGVGLLG